MLSEERHEETTFSFSEKPPQPPERRRESRHLTILRVGALVGPQGRELCLVRNISAGGLMAHVYSRHEMGERVSVELKTTQEIEGFVIWISDSNIGIQFDHPIDVAELLATHVTPDGWRPRTPRVEVDRLATLRCGARLYAANTRDISQGGVKLEVDEALEVGREIVLTMERFRPLQAVVRWCQDGFAGIEFR
ncbi:MAG: PilZ protein, partial [Alphaproteobacteria bacterium]|nr:PilZ protein [Alphaproteobacteria bacterium]